MITSPTTSWSIPDEHRLAPRRHSATSAAASSTRKAQRFSRSHFLQRVREREEEKQHRALEGVMHVGRAQRRENHEQVDVDRAGQQRTHALDVRASRRKVAARRTRRERQANEPPIAPSSMKMKVAMS